MAPTSLSEGDAEHPFEAALGFRDIAPESPVTKLSDIPPASVVTAPNRVIEFESAWVGKERNQLDLKVGAYAMQGLGWKPGASAEVFPAVWRPVLILMSQQRYTEVQREDFTQGSLRLK